MGGSSRPHRGAWASTGSTSTRSTTRASRAACTRSRTSIACTRCCRDGGDPDELLSGFTKAAPRGGIAVMMDLVINHTAKDALLVEQHPEWYRRETDGELRSPRAVDPVDPRKFTVWGDLAELDYDNPSTRPAQVEYWVGAGAALSEARLQGLPLRCRLPGAGRDLAAADRAARRRATPSAGSSPRRSAARRRRCWGSRARASTICSTAPSGGTSARPGCWSSTISTARSRRPSRFPRATTPSASRSSSATPSRRSSSGSTACATCSRRRFSSGVLMPMGYEFGCRTRMDVVKSRPGDWEWETAKPRIDLTGFIGAVNRMSAATPGAQRRGAAAARSPRRTARWSGCCDSRAATCPRPTTPRSC